MFKQFFGAYKKSFKFSTVMYLLCVTICKQSSAMDSLEYSPQLSVEQNKAFVDILLACDEKSLEVIEAELERHREHIDVVLNHVDYFNWTCLKMAMLRGDIRIVKLLHQRGAQLHLADKNGINAIQHAASSDKLNEMLNYFLTVNPDILQITDARGKSLIDFAKKNYAMLNCLVINEKIKIIKKKVE